MKRIGLTLLEVLMAIFIMGVGMLSILAMYPVAADMLGRAINNNQMAEGMVGARSVQDNFDIITSQFSYLLRLFPTTQLGLNSTYSSTPYDPDEQTEPYYKSTGNANYLANPIFGRSNLPVGWLPGEQPATDYPLYLFVDQHGALGNIFRYFSKDINGNSYILPAYLGVDNAFIPNITYPPVSMPYPGITGKVFLPRLKKYSDMNMKQAASRFFTVNGDVVLNQDGLANKDDDNLPVSLDRTGKFTLSYFYEKPFPRTFSNISNRYILVFKDRPDVIKDFPLIKEDLVNPINTTLSTFSKITIPSYMSTGDSSFVFRPRQWLAATALKFGPTMPPSLIDLVEIKSVSQNPNTDEWEIEVSPPLRGAVNRLYFLSDVSYVFYTGR